MPEDWGQYKVPQQKQPAPTNEWDQFKVKVEPKEKLTWDESAPTWEHKDIDPVIDLARHPVALAASKYVSGKSGPASGAATYGTVDYLMQKLKSKQDRGLVASGLNMEAGGLPANITNTLEQLGLSKIIGGLFKAPAVLRNADKPDIFNFAPTTSQALAATGSSKLASVAKTFEDLALSSKEKALDRTAGAGFTQALKTAKANGFEYIEDPNISLNAIRGQVPLTIGAKYQPLRKGQSFQPATPGEPSINSFSQLDNVIKDAKKLEETLTTAQTSGLGANLRKDLQSYQFSKIWNEAKVVDPKTGIANRLDSSKFTEALYDEKMQESYTKLFGSEGFSNIKQFFKNVAATQEKAAYHPTTRRLLLIGGGASLPLGMFTGNIGPGTIAATGLYLSADGIGRLLNKPATARLMVRLAGNEALNMSDDMAGRIISKAINGTTVALIDAQGNKMPAKVEDGRFVPLPQ